MSDQNFEINILVSSFRSQDYISFDFFCLNSMQLEIVWVWLHQIIASSSNIWKHRSWSA